MNRLPNFLYIGPDKAGSTWLHEVLIKHPDVWLTPAKDLYYFDRYYSRGPEWYARQFAQATDENVVGEICQDYLSEESAPSRIKDTLGSPTMMATLRDPVQRSFSSYLYMRKHGEGPDTFLKALRTKSSLLHHSRYGEQLERFHEHFRPECFHIAIFDDLKDDPQAFLDALLHKLGVAPLALPPEDLDSRLPASRARSLPVAWTVRQAANVVRHFDGATLVGKVKRHPLVHRALYVPITSKPEISPDARAYVQEALADDVRLAESISGLPLRERWGW